MDSRRIFLTAWLVYIAFWNPWLQTGMTWSVLDAAVSLAETGRWQVAHAELYGFAEASTSGDRSVTAYGPGLPVLIVPVYLVWRLVAGAIETAGGFRGLNAVLSLTLAPAISALIAVEVARLASWYGAGRKGRIFAALLVAFGTQAFFFGTSLMKENFAALAVLMSFRLAVTPGGPGRRAVAGALGAFGAAIAYPVALLPVLLIGVLVWREGVRRAAVFVAGMAPCVLGLAGLNTALYGRPWRTGYAFLRDFPVWAHRPEPAFVPPKLPVLADLLIGTEGGLFLYAPFLLLAVAGLIRAARTRWRGEAAVTALFVFGLWLSVASWDSQFADRAGWNHSLGPRQMFPGIPLLAAFAGPVLDVVSRRTLAVVAVPSLVSGYLGAQAGFGTAGDSLAYALKTAVSGTGMGILFKEALPAWLGIENLHTVVRRPEVDARELLARLPTWEGFALAVNQAWLLAANVALMVGLLLVLRRLWRAPADTVRSCAS